MEELTGPASRPRGQLYVRGIEPIPVIEPMDEIRARLDEASDSDFIPFTVLAMLGSLSSPKWDAHEINIERASIWGYGNITKAKWEDRLNDLRQQAMSPGLTMSLPVGMGR